MRLRLIAAIILIAKFSLATESLILSIPDENIYDQADFSIDLIANDHIELSGIAGTFKFNPDLIQFDSLTSSALLGFNTRNINDEKMNHGYISFIYLNPRSENIYVNKAASLFTLHFHFKSNNCPDSSQLQMSNEEVPWELVSLKEQMIKSNYPKLDTVQIRRACKMSMATIKSISPKCVNDYNGEIKVQIYGGFPPYQFIWSNGQKLPEIKNLKEGQYHLTITDHDGNTIHQSFNLSKPASLSIEMNIQNSACNLSLGEIQVYPTEKERIQIQWEDSELSDTFLKTDLKAGIYPFTIWNDTGCSKDTFAIVEDFYLDKPLIEDSIWLCPNQTITMVPPDGMVDVNWYRDSQLILANSTEFTPEQAGDFRVKFFISDQCSTSRKFTVILPDIERLTIHDTTVKKGSTLKLDFNPQRRIIWHSDHFLIFCDTCFSNEIIVDKKGFISIKITDRNGCTQEKTIFINVEDALFQILNTVTPNNDHINDYFSIPETMTASDIKVFNTYGSELGHFENTDELNQWLQNIHHSSGTYYLSINLSDPSTGSTKNYLTDLNIIR